jgi:hypothetical protein
MPVKIAAGEADIAGFYLMQLNERLPKLAHCACAVEGPHRQARRRLGASSLNDRAE